MYTRPIKKMELGKYYEDGQPYVNLVMSVSHFLLFRLLE